MPKLPVLSGSDVVKILSRMGFTHVRTHGSHAILNKTDAGRGKITIPIPLHKELAKGTLRSIMRQAEMNIDDLLNLMK
ncbi:MAG TPA: type II toxin-antitoxin system HicA family toxin [Candidatus Nanoarchaeia archaeon]|nr:type II toxin-antitoxin system HicA family toxin [Candidatus Nanoarchaeia archaeon]